MNLVDSSAGLEYFADGPNASFFATAIQKSRELIVPTVVILEVYKRILQQRNARAALEAVAALRQGHIIDLTATLAMPPHHSVIPKDCRWPIASFSQRRAQKTRSFGRSDADFERITGVKFRARR